MKAGFPWDFDQSTWATPAFWTASINSGIIPHWIPYQSMGYPLFLKAQGGFHYPALWVFALSGIPYTLQAAVIFQILHIFVGSIGMFFFLNHLLKSPKYAIMGAVAFQFFGGFFANAEHVTIVRGFVFAPWLFYVLMINMEGVKITKKNLFIPAVIYLISTGAYPGIFISSVFIAFLFIIFQSSNLILKGFDKFKSLLIGGSMVGLVLLGLLLAMIHIGPLTQYGSEALIRFDTAGSLIYNVLTVEQFPGFFMSNTPIPNEISMTSTFITLPMMILVSFVSWNYIKKYWIFVGIFIISVLMAVGNQTPFWSSITSLFSSLELSRFVISDYRIFIAIPLLVFSILGAKSLIEGKISFRSFYFRTFFVISWFIFGVITLQQNISKAWRVDYEGLNGQIIFSSIILITTLLVLSIYLIKLKNISFEKRKIEISTVLMLIIIALVVADGFRVISDMITWTKFPYDEKYLSKGIPLEKNGKFAPYEVIENIPNSRPERIEDYNHLDIPWRGVLTGEYMMQDTGRSMFVVVKEVTEKNNIYREYMAMKWTPIFLPPPNNLENNSVKLNDELFSGNNLENKNSVIQTRYGINNISYNVSLTEPALMIENEVYFDGWTAVLKLPDQERKISAINVNGVFRGWILPAGNYEMISEFQFPDYSTYQTISTIALIMWIFVSIGFFKKSKSSSLKNLQ